MNWKNKIILTFICFASFIIYMVVRAFQEDFNLVTEDYYAQEINYQNRLNQKANLDSLAKKVLVTIEDDSIKLVFPTSAPSLGELHFYHPSKKHLDRFFPIVTDAHSSQSIPNSALIKGHYRINITWKADGIEYFQQEKIHLQ